MLGLLRFQGIDPELYHPGGDYPPGGGTLSYPERAVYEQEGRWYSHIGGSDRVLQPNRMSALQVVWDSLDAENVPQDWSDPTPWGEATATIGVDGRGFVYTYTLQDGTKLAHRVALQRMAEYIRGQ